MSFAGAILNLCFAVLLRSVASPFFRPRPPLVPLYVFFGHAQHGHRGMARLGGGGRGALRTVSAARRGQEKTTLCWRALVRMRVGSVHVRASFPGWRLRWQGVGNAAQHDGCWRFFSISFFMLGSPRRQAQSLPSPHPPASSYPINPTTCVSSAPPVSRPTHP